MAASLLQCVATTYGTGVLSELSELSNSGQGRWALRAGSPWPLRNEQQRLEREFADAVAPVGKLIARIGDILRGQPDRPIGGVDLTVGVVTPAANPTKLRSHGEAIVRASTGAVDVDDTEVAGVSALDGVRRAQEGVGAGNREGKGHVAVLALIYVRVDQVLT